MTSASVFILAVSMSADAFAAAIARGAVMTKPRLIDALKIAFVFGSIETIMPILGWAAGLAANQIITAYDHWIAYVILLLVGAHMITQGLIHHEDKDTENAPPPEDNKKSSRKIIVLTAIGTSIDAMAVGVTLAFMEMNIIIAALSIGLATFCMASIGIMAGHYIGARNGRLAEIAGGAGLIAIGHSILMEHLGVWG